MSRQWDTAVLTARLHSCHRVALVLVHIPAGGYNEHVDKGPGSAHMAGAGGAEAGDSVV